MLKLSAKEDENVSIWKRLPRVYWVARVTRGKAGAQILVIDEKFIQSHNRVWADIQAENIELAESVSEHMAMDQRTRAQGSDEGNRS